MFAINPVIKIVVRESIRATTTVIVVPIRVHVRRVVAVGYTSVRRVIVPIAAAFAGAHAPFLTPHLLVLPFISNRKLSPLDITAFFHSSLQ